MNNNIKSFFMENKIIRKCESYLLKKTQNQFGKVYQIDTESYPRDVMKSILLKFIKKYDKKFEFHVQNKNDELTLNLDSIFLVPLEVNENGVTMMLITSGLNISGSQIRAALTNNSTNIDDFYIYIFGKKMRKYSKELEDLITSEFNKSYFGIFTVDAGHVRDEKEESLDIMYMDLEPRDMSTLFFSDNEKEEICKHIDKFEENYNFYKSRQLLYKTGILLYGQPGTGKSSLIKAIGSKYGRELISINVNNIKNINLTSLTQSINVDDVRKYVIILEDIDTLYLNRDDVESDKHAINKLLQFLDSNTSPNNVIFIATTNHLDRLDNALLREGRFDLKVEVNPLLYKDAVKFINSFDLSEYEANAILETMKNTKNGINHDGDNLRYNQSTIQAMALSKINKRNLDDITAIYGNMEDTSKTV